MSFKMKCPKCESHSYSVERDTRTYATGKSGELVFSCRCGKQLFGDQLTAEYDRQKGLWEADPVRQAAANAREQRLQEEAARQEALRQAFEYRRAWVAQKRLGIAHPHLTTDHQLTADQLAGALPAGSRAPGAGVATPPEATEQRPAAPHVAEPRRTPDTRSTKAAPLASAAPRTEPARRAEPAPTHDTAATAEAGSGACEWPGCTNTPAPNSKYCSRTCSNKNARLRHARRKKGSQVAA